MRFILTIFVMGMLSMTQAHADSWFVLNYGDGVCEAAPMSPAEFASTLRQQGSIPQITITSDSDGGKTVEIGFNNDNDQPVVIDLFTSIFDCEQMRQQKINNGNIPDYKALQ